MAGLGESCRHVASLLWAVEAGVRLRDSMMVTQKKTYWVLPPCVKDVPYSPLSGIKFKGKSATSKEWKAFRTPSPSVDQAPSPTPSPSPSPAVYISFTITNTNGEKNKSSDNGRSR